MIKLNYAVGIPPGRKNLKYTQLQVLKLKMSHKGRMLRGEKWYNCRNQDGELPEDIKTDEGKMCDVNYFLEKQPKPKEEKKKGGK